MISIKNLTFSFGNKMLYKNLNIEMQSGQITVITGLNGVGKTTLLRIISGEIKTDGADVFTDCKKIFFLPQKVSYPYGITLFEYILSFFYLKSFKWFTTKSEKRKVTEILELLGLSDRKDIYVEKLSSGELQLANLAIAMVSDADCLLLDEPASNLDLKNQVKISRILKTLTKKGITCVMITHDLNIAVECGDYFVGISQNVVVQGIKQEFFVNENLKKIYGLNFNVELENEKIYLKTID